MEYAHFELQVDPNTGEPRELGRGAMGITYRARDTRLLVDVVLKVIRPEIVNDETVRQRFVREARAAARVRHPNVAAVLHLHDEPPCFYAMELINGRPLRDLLREHGARPLAEALEYTQQAASALAAIDREKLVHRDLKPANLMLVADPERPLGQRVVLIDFGLARGVRRGNGERAATLAEALSAEGEFTGTPLYASPEQAAGVDDLDIRSDVYSLGVVFWQMLVGTPPFVGATPLQTLSMHQFREPPWERLETLPPAVRALLRQMLAKEPGDRPAPDALRRQILELQASPGPGRPAPVVLPPLPSVSPTAGAAGPDAHGQAPTSHEAAGAAATPVGWLRGFRLPAAVGVLAGGLILSGILVFTRPASVVPPSPAVVAASPDAKPANSTAPSPPDFQNDLGLRFVAVPAAGVSFSVWETRMRDYGTFLKESGYQTPNGETAFVIAMGAWRQWFGADWKTPGFPQTPDDPVVGVSWEDASAFCRWLTRRERAAGRIGADREFRLPTDAEWSAAAGLRDEAGATAVERGRTARDAFVWGTAWPPTPGAGNFSDESSDVHRLNPEWNTIPGYRDGFPRTAPVGQFQASASGLHDMAGNAWEWCQDTGEAASDRVARGGSWFNSSKESLRVGAREGFPATRRMADVGFRVVLAPVRP